MYHTQERRQQVLTSAVICTSDDAWLGDAFYFWADKRDAEAWGITSKTKTGYYEVYSSLIKSEKILDTVFNESHYDFYLMQVEKIAQKIYQKTQKKATRSELNQYFKDRGDWDAIDGILFQDFSNSPSATRVVNFFYRKRIQIAVYNEEIIHDFKLIIVKRC